VPCANCGASVTGLYCSECGQAARLPSLTLGGFIRDTTHELTNWDGKVPSTLLTADVIAGRRARWLTPLRVYLICSLLFFGARPLLLSLTGRSPRDIAQIQTDLERTPAGELTPQAREELARGLPGRILGAERIERAVADPKRFNRELDAAFPNAMFLLLPFFALLTSVAWRRRLRSYPAHLYLALHFHAALFGALTVFWLVASFTPWPGLAVVALLGFFGYVVWYALAMFRRVFDESWPRTFLKSLAVATIYSFIFFMTTFLLLAWAILRM
jgi:hypothetical protein